MSRVKFLRFLAAVWSRHGLEFRSSGSAWTAEPSYQLQADYVQRWGPQGKPWCACSRGFQGTLKSPFFFMSACEQAVRLRDVGRSHARTAVGRRCFAMSSRVLPRLALLATQNGESTQRRHVFRVFVCFFFLFCNSIQTGTGTSSLVNLPRSDTKLSNLFTKG